MVTSLPGLTGVPAAGLCQTTVPAGAVEVVPVLPTGVRPAPAIVARAAATSSPRTSGTVGWCWPEAKKTATVLPAATTVPAAGRVLITWPFGTDGELWLRKRGRRWSAVIFCPACCAVRPRTSGTGYVLPLLPPALLPPLRPLPPLASVRYPVVRTAASTSTPASTHSTARRRWWPGGGPAPSPRPRLAVSGGAGTTRPPGHGVCGRISAGGGDAGSPDVARRRSARIS